jgi:hypothetical protein
VWGVEEEADTRRMCTMIRTVDYSKDEELQVQISDAVKDALRPQDGVANTFDVDVVVSEIIRFVFRRKPDVTPNNRYEWYYILLGKAVSIASGWRQNCSSNVGRLAETHDSIVAYIENTYGVHDESNYTR